FSSTERRAAAAERDAIDRFVAAFLADRVGAILPGRVTGVTRFGLFIRLEETGADGLVPIASLPNDFYDHDEVRHALVGRRWGRVYRLGEQAMVRLVQAEPLTGGLLLELIEASGIDGPPAPLAFLAVAGCTSGASPLAANVDYERDRRMFIAGYEDIDQYYILKEDLGSVTVGGLSALAALDQKITVARQTDKFTLSYAGTIAASLPVDVG